MLWRNGCGDSKTSTRGVTYHALRFGVATGSSQRPSSSGRAGRTGCTTVCVTVVVMMVAGAWSASSLRSACYKAGGSSLLLRWLRFFEYPEEGEDVKLVSY